MLEKQLTCKAEQIKSELDKKLGGAQKVLDENTNKEEEKKNTYLTKQELKALQIAEKERQKKFEMDEKRRKEMEKEQKIKDMLKRNDHVTNEKNDRLMFKLSLTDEKVASIQKQQQEQIIQKKNMNKIKTEELLKNLDRMKDAQEQKSHKVLSKLAKDNERTHKMKKEQEAVVDLHQKLKQDMAKRKEQILNAYFQKQRKVKSFISASDNEDTKHSDFFATSLSPVHINTVQSIRD